MADAGGSGGGIKLEAMETAEFSGETDDGQYGTAILSTGSSSATGGVSIDAANMEKGGM